MEILRQLIQGVRDAWLRLSASARVNVVVAGLAVITFVAFAAYFGARPQYVTLSSGLSPQEGARIVDVLTQQGVRWREQNNYERILIPLSDRSRVQLALAEANLPVGAAVPPGWELFETTELMTNQWLQNVRFMRAVQGELQRQLNAFDFVEYSHVLIREAPDVLYSREQRASEAAVILKTTRSLTARETKALVSLVSRAGGPHLNANNVTIATTEGTPLWLPPQEGFTSLASSNLEAITEYEGQREAKIMAKLRTMGINATVSVSAQLNFEEREVDSEQVSEGTELSIFATESSTTTSDLPPVGAPGTLAQLPEGMAREGGSQVIDSSLEEITNFEPSITRTRTKVLPGNVVKYNVAVLLERQFTETTDDAGNVTRTAVPLDEEHRIALERLVLAAVGEGDVPTEVSIHDIPWNLGELAATTTELAQAAQAVTWQQALPMLGAAGQILLIIIGFFLVRRFLRRAIARGPEQDEDEIAVEIPEATREDLRRQEVAQELTGLSARDPDAVAALLRTWMNEEED